MKKISITAALLSCTTLPAQASEIAIPEQYFYFGAHVSEYFYDIGDHVNGDKIDDTGLPGLQVGYRFNPDWSLQLWWERNDFDSKDGTIPDGDLNALIASARYHFVDQRLIGFEPYAGLAIADLDVDINDSDHETLAGAELGLQRMLHPRWLLDLGARPLYSFDNERFDTEAYVALNYLIGHPAKTVNNNQTPASSASTKPRDADRDGVADSDDQCPQTPANTSVDSRGCELDSDGDQVADSHDQCADTPVGAKVDEVGCRIKLTAALQQTFYFNFASGTANLSQDSASEVERLATLLRAYPDSTVTLEGHTDSQGAAAANLSLSEKRAGAVRQALLNQYSIDANRVTAAGKGEQEAIADNNTAEGRSKNRRVEVIINAANTL